MTMRAADSIQLHTFRDRSAVALSDSYLHPGNQKPSENTEESMRATAEESAVELPPVDRGVKAWSFVAAAFVLETLVWGFGFTYGVFQEHFLHQRTFGDASGAALGAIGTITLAIEYFEVLLIILITQHWPEKAKRLMWASLGLCCVSLVLASFATRVWHMILLQGVLFGIGGGGLYGPVFVYLSEWFVARRGLANAIIFGGSGAGGALFPIAVNYLLTHVGFRWTLRIWAAFMLGMGGLAVAFIRPRLPIAHAHDNASPTFWQRVRRQHWGFLKTPLFICVSTTIFVQALAYFPVSLYMSVYTSSLGLPPLNGTLVLSVFNLSSVIGKWAVLFLSSNKPFGAGQILFGHFCDVAPYRHVMVLSGTGAALSAYLLWGFAHSLGLIFAFVVIFGSLSGGYGSIWPAASVEVAGSEPSSISNIFGCFSMVKGMAAVIGPLIAAALHHPEQAASKSTYSGYGFKDVTLFVGTMMVVTAAGGLSTKFAKRWSL